VAQWKLRDPLLRHAEQLRASGVSDVDIEGVTTRVAAEIERITTEALAAPTPPADTAWTDMWSDGSSRWRN
jgi:TPP-dependent pyruvate/acetoin dehydrogenase alpha subunit